MLYVTIPLGASLTQIAYGPGSLGTLIGNVVGLAIIVAAIFTLLWMLLGGISWITSGGDKAKVEEARDKITQAVIGFVLVMATWAIWTLITTRFFGLNLTGGGGGGTSTSQSLPATSPRDCATNCTYGTQLCYRQCIPERPTHSEAVGCPNGSWITYDEQTDPACPPH